MNKRYMVSLLAVIVLFLLAYVGVSAVPATKWLFGVIIPYAAVFIFIVFFIRRILAWARVPVPFKIPTTGGQQNITCTGHHPGTDQITRRRRRSRLPGAGQPVRRR